MGTPYYRFFPADYDRDTKHLSMMQHGAYRLLIDWYMNIGPLPNDMEKIHRTLRATSREEQAAVEYVLVEFYKLDGGRWNHKRCDEELDYQRSRSEVAARSADARWHNKSNANAMRTHSEGNAIQNQNQNQNQTQRKTSAFKDLPLSVKHQTDGEKPLRASRAALSAPPDVSAQVWADFLQTRKALKAAVTPTAIAGIRREAQKASLSLEDALRMCCARGWRGFKAEWVDSKTKRGLDIEGTRAILFGNQGVSHEAE